MYFCARHVLMFGVFLEDRRQRVKNMVIVSPSLGKFIIFLNFWTPQYFYEKSLLRCVSKGFFHKNTEGV